MNSSNSFGRATPITGLTQKAQTGCIIVQHIKQTQQKNHTYPQDVGSSSEGRKEWPLFYHRRKDELTHCCRHQKHITQEQRKNFLTHSKQKTNTMYCNRHNHWERCGQCSLPFPAPDRYKGEAWCQSCMLVQPYIHFTGRYPGMQWEHKPTTISTSPNPMVPVGGVHFIHKLAPCALAMTMTACHQVPVPAIKIMCLHHMLTYTFHSEAGRPLDHMEHWPCLSVKKVEKSGRLLEHMEQSLCQGVNKMEKAERSLDRIELPVKLLGIEKVGRLLDYMQQSSHQDFKKMRKADRLLDYLK